MPDIKKDECAGAWVGEDLVCAHCLTEEDNAALQGVLSKDEIDEARTFLCSRCNKEIK